MPHDFKNFPELTNRQMEIYYFESPHKQIVGDFTARVVKITDGDTIRLEVDFRDFDFPLRMSGIAAPELNEKGGEESRSWLKDKILGEEVKIRLSKSRVEKWGRLLGKVMVWGTSVGQESIQAGHATAWEQREQAQIPNFNKKLGRIKL